jgi:hypothetical protein
MSKCELAPGNSCMSFLSPWSFCVGGNYTCNCKWEVLKGSEEYFGKITASVIFKIPSGPRFHSASQEEVLIRQDTIRQIQF